MQRLRHDRRVVMLRLSDEGRALAPEISRRLDTFNATLTQGLSDRDVGDFTDAVVTMIANYEAANPRR